MRKRHEFLMVKIKRSSAVPLYSFLDHITNDKAMQRKASLLGNARIYS